MNCGPSDASLVSWGPKFAMFVLPGIGYLGASLCFEQSGV